MILNAPGVDKLGISMQRRWRTRTAPLLITPRIVSYQQQDDVAADLVGQVAAKTQQQSVNVFPIALCLADRRSEPAVPLPESFLVALQKRPICFAARADAFEKDARTGFDLVGEGKSGERD